MIRRHDLVMLRHLKDLELYLSFLKAKLIISRIAFNNNFVQREEETIEISGPDSLSLKPLFFIHIFISLLITNISLLFHIPIPCDKL